MAKVKWILVNNVKVWEYTSSMHTQKNDKNKNNRKRQSNSVTQVLNLHQGLSSVAGHLILQGIHLEASQTECQRIPRGSYRTISRSQGECWSPSQPWANGGSPHLYLIEPLVDELLKLNALLLGLSLLQNSTYLHKGDIHILSTHASLEVTTNVSLVVADDSVDQVGGGHALRAITLTVTPYLSSLGGAETIGLLDFSINIIDAISAVGKGIVANEVDVVLVEEGDVGIPGSVFDDLVDPLAMTKRFVSTPSIGEWGHTSPCLSWRSYPCWRESPYRSSSRPSIEIGFRSNTIK